MLRNKFTRWASPLLLGGFLLGSTACSSSLPELTIQLDKLAPSDTIAYVTYVGDGVQQTDTLLHFPQKLTLTPDTARVRTLSFVHAGGEQVLFYAWDGKQWSSQEIRPVADSLVSQAPIFTGRDVAGKERTLSELYAHHPIELVFASPETMKSLTKAEQRQLRQSSKPDSLTFVFLYATTSDSTARRLLRQDSLQGIAFSDSLGLVSDLRRRYGVAQEAQAVRLRIDTLGRIHR